MQFRNLLLSVLACTLSILLHAQGALPQTQSASSLGGTVTSQAGVALPSATIKLSNTALGNTTLGNTTLATASDEAGQFFFSKVKPGSYTLEISALGYQTQAKQVTLNPGQQAQIEVILQQVAIEMQTVTVVGRTETQQTNRQAFNITAIDAKKLYNTTLDLAGALDRVSGVRLRESGGVGSNFNLSVNGFSGSHVRYFIDGIPMDNFGSSFQINNIPINIADRLEVYKGVVPIWLGSDALGGAINIITSERYRNYLDVSYSYGSFNTHRTVVNAVVTSKSGFTVGLNAFQNYSDNDYKVKVDAADINTGAYTPGASVRRFHDTYHNQTLIANAGFVNKNFADKFLIGITLGKNYKEIQTGARMVSVFGGWHRRGQIIMPTLKYKKTNLIRGLDLTVNANYNLGSEQNIDTMNVRYDWFGNSKPNGSNGERARSLYTYRNNNGIVNALFNYRLSERGSVALSNVFTTFNRKGNDPLNPSIAEYELPKKTQKNVMGLGYSHQVKDQWSASVFGKYIYQNNLNGTAATSAATNKVGYGVAATYFLTPNLQLKASYERTNRMPEAQEIFGDVENQEGNPNLKPEQSDNFNLGVRFSFAIDSNNKFLINANAIYRRSDKFIYNRLNNNQSKLVADNRDGVRTMGGEGEIRYSYKDWLSVGTTLTYQYLQNMQRYEPDFTGVSPVYKDQMPNVPYLFGNSDASVSLKDVFRKGNSLNIGYNLLYVHAFYLYWPSRGGNKLNIPQQLSHDLNLVYSLKNGRYNIGLEARNLTNALLYDNFSLQKPTRAFYVNLRYFLNQTI